jgi:hypothetical protein
MKEQYGKKVKENKILKFNFLENFILKRYFAVLTG